MNKKSLGEEQNDYRGQLKSLLEHFNKQVDKVKLLQRESILSMYSAIQTPNQSEGTLVRGTVGSPIKLINPPSLPLFSGVDPTPKDEVNYEQWLFQAVGIEIPHKRGSMIRDHKLCKR